MLHARGSNGLKRLTLRVGVVGGLQGFTVRWLQHVGVNIPELKSEAHQIRICFSSQVTDGYNRSCAVGCELATTVRILPPYGDRDPGPVFGGHGGTEALPEQKIERDLLAAAHVPWIRVNHRLRSTEWRHA